eukprot:m.27696 g.27696  ORF g.27696 m.27696 type:complete len:57 (-) comp11945_c0_seq2:537-707(-)
MSDLPRGSSGADADADPQSDDDYPGHAFWMFDEPAPKPETPPDDGTSTVTDPQVLS